MSEYTKYDLIYIPTGEVIMHEEIAVTIANTLNVKAKSLRAKVSGAKKKQSTFGNYLVKQCGEISNVLATHRKLSELVDEFLRVCKYPELWGKIDNTYLGDWYINDQGKAVMYEEEV